MIFVSLLRFIRYHALHWTQRQYMPRNSLRRREQLKMAMSLQCGWITHFGYLCVNSFKCEWIKFSPAIRTHNNKSHWLGNREEEEQPKRKVPCITINVVNALNQQFTSRIDEPIHRRRVRCFYVWKPFLISF